MYCLIFQTHPLSQTTGITVLCVLSILLNFYFLIRAYCKNRDRAREGLSRGLSSIRRGKENSGMELSPEPSIEVKGMVFTVLEYKVKVIH